MTRVIALTDFDLETERLRLRPLQACDEALYCGLYTDAETMRYIGEPLAPVRVARCFRKVLCLMYKQPIEWLSLTVLDKATQLPVGICGVPAFDATASRLEVGMMLRRQARTRGLAREGLEALVRKLFSVLSVGEIWVEYSPEHSAAGGLVRSMGFSPRAEPVTAGESLGKCIWSACRETWYSTAGDVDRQGRVHVERSPVSGNNGTKCRAEARSLASPVQGSE
ncbi:MAG: GNAT family N-acetyltransferase [Rudaea sp.]|nr:GNAT family N-acetyltransferase [Rudaea sp.]